MAQHYDTVRWQMFNEPDLNGETTSDYLNRLKYASDATTSRHYLYCANANSSGYTYSADFSAWNIPTNQQVLVEEVGSTCYGAGKYWTNTATGGTLAVTQSANTVLLFTIPSHSQQPVQTILASDDAMVADGANAGVNYGSATNLVVRNHSTDTGQRSAAFIKFHLPQPLNPALLQLAVLSVTASSINGAASVQAHVYGIINNTWSENSMVWTSAPNLGQNISAGSEIFNNFVAGAGDATRGVAAANSAQLVGQLVATNVAAERFVDVTDFLKQHPGADFSFLLAREVRFSGDTQNSDGMTIVSKDGSTNNSPRLKLVLSVPAAAPRFNSIIPNSNRTVTLTVAATAGQTNSLQVSTNLASASWATLVSTNVMATNGVWTYTDAPATNSAARFYRVSVP